jgi:hypothetical protein
MMQFKMAQIGLMLDIYWKTLVFNYGVPLVVIGT